MSSGGLTGSLGTLLYILFSHQQKAGAKGTSPGHPRAFKLPDQACTWIWKECPRDPHVMGGNEAQGLGRACLPSCLSAPRLLCLIFLG